MARMKTFLIYFLILVAFYFLSNFIIGFTLYSTYKSLDANAGTIQTENYDIKIGEAKATTANGSISGQITKKDDGSDSNKYLKIDFFSKNNQFLGSEYAKIDDLLPGQTKNFTIPFKYSNVGRYVVSTVNEIGENNGIYAIHKFFTNIDWGIEFLIGLIIVYSVL